MFSRLFRKDPAKLIARQLYDGLVAAARRPAFYTQIGVHDDVDGRFDMIVLHAVLVMRRLRAGDEAGRDMAQLVFDIMFDDMDAALREMGTGDLSVGKKIREMGEAFYGRAKAYEAPLSETDSKALADAILRNMFDGEAPDDAPARLAAFALASEQVLADQPLESLMAGQAPRFADPV